MDEVNGTWVRRAGGAAVLAALILAGAWMAQRVYVRKVPPAAEASDPGERAGFEAAARRFTGSVVWSSNRSGSHEIYRLDLVRGSARLRALTASPYVDTFPRFSPDRSRIVFNRSREPWVSFREQAGWDVWIMNADGTKPRRIAEVGFHPSFTPGGKVVFARRGEIIRLDPDSGREQRLLSVETELGGWAQEPELRGRKVALTVRGRGRRAFGVYDLRAHRFHELSGDSCQIGWWPGGKRLFWVEAEGNGGNRIRWASADGADVSTLMDLPGERSHEYFPRPSRDGRWLVWGAAASGHEHDRADYDIYLWRIGDPWTEALRLTRYGGNDQWPDLLVAEGGPE